MSLTIYIAVGVIYKEQRNWLF